jgi:hypothetical protein
VIEEAIARVGEALLWPVRRQRWVWAMPLLVYLAAYSEQPHMKLGIEAIVGVIYVAFAASRPYKSLTLLVVLLPFNVIILSTLYRMHVPSMVVRGLDFWKEGLVAGLAVAAARNWARRRPRLDWADRLALAYVALGCVYLLFQHLMVGNAAGGHASFYARELGWRADVLYVGLFVICRHLGLERKQVQLLLDRALKVILVVAAVGVYEFFRPWSFNNFLVNTVQLPRYDANIVHTPVANPRDLLIFASNGHVRIGSLLVDNLLDGFYFLVGLGLALERITRSRAPLWVILSLPVIGLGVVFTQSRAAMLGAALVVIWALRSQIGRSLARRLRLGVLVGCMALVGLPLLLFGGAFHRFVSSGNSNSGHTSAVSKGLRIMGEDPLGRGLATGAGGGQTAAAKGAVTATTLFIPENQWLEIGTQLGVLGLVLYSGAIVLIVTRSGPRAGREPLSGAGSSAAGMQSALLGLLGGGLFLTPFIEPIVSWTVFSLCGVAASVFDSAPPSYAQADKPEGYRRSTALARTGASLAHPPIES